MIQTHATGRRRALFDVDVCVVVGAFGFEIGESASALSKRSALSSLLPEIGVVVALKTASNRIHVSVFVVCVD